MILTAKLMMIGTGLAFAVWTGIFFTVLGSLPMPPNGLPGYMTVCLTSLFTVSMILFFIACWTAARDDSALEMATLRDGQRELLAKMAGLQELVTGLAGADDSVPRRRRQLRAALSEDTTESIPVLRDVPMSPPPVGRVVVVPIRENNRRSRRPPKRTGNEGAARDPGGGGGAAVDVMQGPVVDRYLGDAAALVDLGKQIEREGQRRSQGDQPA